MLLLQHCEETLVSGVSTNSSFHAGSCFSLISQWGIFHAFYKKLKEIVLILSYISEFVHHLYTASFLSIGNFV